MKKTTIVINVDRYSGAVDTRRVVPINLRRTVNDLDAYYKTPQSRVK